MNAFTMMSALQVSAILVHILQFLKWEQNVGCRRVSKCWKQAVNKSMFLLPNAHLEKWYNQSWRQGYAYFVGNTRRLKSIVCDRRDLWAIAAHNPNLQRVDGGDSPLSDSTWFTRHLRRLHGFCKDIRGLRACLDARDDEHRYDGKFEAGHPRMIDTIFTLWRKLERLETLYLENPFGIQPHQLRCAKHLTHLSLGIGDCTDLRDVTTIVQHLPSLTDLSLRDSCIPGCPGRVRPIKNWYLSSSSLRRLQFYFWDNLIFEPLDGVDSPYNLPLLEEFNAEVCPVCWNAADIYEALRLPNIRRVRMSVVNPHCFDKWLDWDCLPAGCDCLPFLESLTVWCNVAVYDGSPKEGVETVLAGLLDIIWSAPKLEKLEVLIYGCEDLEHTPMDDSVHSDWLSQTKNIAAVSLKFYGAKWLKSS